MKQRVFGVSLLAVFILFTVPACAQQPTAAQRVEIDARIAAELTELEAQIKDAEAQDAKYTGGLIKALGGARLEILQQTRAMLQQRAKAQNLNVQLRYTVNGRPFTTPADADQQVSGIEAELTALRSKIATEKADAARYSGGLVLAMKLSSIATMEQTEAMLDQKRVSLKYGLPQYLGFQTQGAQAATQPTSTAASIPEAQFEIVSVDARVTESNSTWWKYAWKVVIRNRDAQPHAYRVTVEFQDKDGFIVDTDRADGVVQANSEGTITGYALVTASVAGNIAGTNAKVQEVR